MSASTSQPPSSPFVKRRRAYVACTNCRQRKVRCVSPSEVGDEPCNRCSKRGLKCEYIAIPDNQETSSGGDSTTTPEPLSGSNSPDGPPPAPYTSVSSTLPMDPSYSRRRSSHYANVAEPSYYTPSNTPPLRPVSSQSASGHLSPGPYPSLPYVGPLARNVPTHPSHINTSASRYPHQQPPHFYSSSPSTPIEPPQRISNISRPHLYNNPRTAYPSHPSYPPASNTPYATNLPHDPHANYEYYATTQTNDRQSQWNRQHRG
ncbi:hypothetical protein C8J57DRAFT_1589863 [Mycena rebaudengoi]|nr:hypothetical protein C8J57DRAFT_1589863 [Mycena rebaudengoi]